MTSGVEATGHEAELTKETHHNKVCPAPARSRACPNRGVEQPHQLTDKGSVADHPLRPQKR